MKALKVTKGFHQLLSLMKAHNMGHSDYTHLSDIMVRIIAEDVEVLNQALILSHAVKDDFSRTCIMVNNEVYKTLQTIQARYRARYGTLISLGDIAEGLCTKSLRAQCYRELMDAKQEGD